MMVCMRHLLFLFMRDLILMQGKIKSSIYGLLTELVLLVECLAPGRIALHVLYAKKAMCTSKLQGLVHCCCYMQLHVVLRKKKEYFL